MELQILPNEVKSFITSGTNIISIPHCVQELILNSLDANSSAIAIRINMITCRIQVVDNGDGISKNNLQLIGTRYMTNKCNSLLDYQQNIKYFGYRGEALASILNYSKTLSITTRMINTDETYCKTLTGTDSNELTVVKLRPSAGTTVTIENFLYNMPVRKNRVNPELDFDCIKSYLDALSVIHPKISFTLRNDVTTRMLFKNQTCNFVSEALVSLKAELNKECLIELKVSKNKLRVSGLISTITHVNKKLQFIFVNKRPVHCHALQKMINEKLRESKLCENAQACPIYTINIKCPIADVSFIFENSKCTVNFSQMSFVLKYVEKLLNSFLTKELLNNEKSTQPNLVEQSLEIQSKFGISQMGGAVKKVVRRNKSNKRLADMKHLSLQNRVPFDKSILIDAKKKPEIKQDNIFETQFDSQALNLSYLDEDKRKDLINSANDLDSQILPKEIQESLITSNKFDNEQSGKSLIMNTFLKCTYLYNTDKIKELSKSSNHLSRKRKGTQNCTSIITQNLTVSKVITNDKNREILNSTHLAKLIEENMMQVSKQTDNFYQHSRTENKQTVGVQTCLDRTIKRNEENVNKVEINFKNIDLTRNKSVYLKFNFSTEKSTEVKIDFNKSKYFDTTIDSVKSPTRNNITDKGNNGEEKEKRNDPVVIQDLSKLLLEVNENEHLNTSNVSRYQNSCSSKKISNKTTTKIKNSQGNVCSPYFEKTSNRKGAPLKKYYSSNDLPTNTKHVKPLISERNATQLENNLKANIQILSLKQTSTSMNDEYALFSNGLKDKAIQSSGLNWNSLKKKDFDKDSTVIHEDDDQVLFNKTYIDNSASQHNDYLNSRTGVLYTKDDFNIDSNFKKMDELGERDFLNSIDLMEAFDCNESCNNIATSDNNLKGSEDWIAQEDSHGKTYYIQQKTGLTSYKEIPNQFDFNCIKRSECVPKGQSPAITQVQKINVALSPNSKNKLNEEILKCYEDELNVVKWEHFLLHENDPAQFFAGVYNERNHQSNHVEIPNINKQGLSAMNISNMYNLAQSTTRTFSKSIFSSLEVVGQLDCKFIVTIEKSEKCIVLFDQHAVHERIRLEEITKDYKLTETKYKSTICNLEYSFEFDQSEIQLLQTHELEFNALGLYFKIIDNTLIIQQVPTCLFNKSKKTLDNQLEIFLLALINEELLRLKETRGSIVKNPKVIQNVINTEACRGAIKFGDKLTIQESCNLLDNLSKCILPFQCAHGRPTVIPIAQLR